MTLFRRKIQALLVIALGVLFAHSRPACADAFNFVPFAFPGAAITYAQGINNSGDIVGIAAEPFDSGFLYQNQNFQLFPGIVSISNNGMILATSASGPYIFSGGNSTPLNASGQQVLAINNSGTVLLTTGYLTGSTIHPVSFPGATSTSLRGINDLGEIVGSYTGAGNVSHGFLYDAGVYTTIDFPGAISSTAYAINNNGDIVGNYFVGHAPVGTQGFLYEGGSFQTFDAFNFFSDETATVPTGINDYGEITGYQFESLAGGTESFVATPVPETGTLILVGTGLTMMAGVVRRRC